jgi:hypothetical protein
VLGALAEQSPALAFGLSGLPNSLLHLPALHSTRLNTLDLISQGY